jgi:hypothetical protein
VTSLWKRRIESQTSRLGEPRRRKRPELEETMIKTMAVKMLRLGRSEREAE